MDLTAILYPIYCIGGLGLVFGVGLGLAAKKFAVPVDERVEEVKENLPGANCGGCGFAGCEALAKSIVSGESPANACPVCNASQIEGIAKAMGVEAKSNEKKVAVLRCKGSNIHAKLKYDYAGLQSCADAQLVGGGPKVCTYGCLGYGDCKNACLFGAITVEDGLAIIHPEKCVACGACQKACPRNIIHIVPAYASYHVNCISEDKGKEVKAGCAVGCIGCGICAKQCEVKAITIENNLASIDAVLCVQCGKCKEKCPTKAITNLLEK